MADTAYRSTGTLREMALAERPQERLERYGAQALSDTELLAMLLRSGSKGLDVLAVSQYLITEAGSLSGLMRWSAEDFAKVRGIGRVKALQLVTVMEVARRVLSVEAVEIEPLLDNSESVYRLFRPITAGLEVEKFWVLCLNRRNRLIRRVEVTSGTLGASLAHPREVFREAIRLAASVIIVVHNHPSGDPAPSTADLRVTQTLKTAGEAVDIPLVDHVIVGEKSHDPEGEGFYSFSSAGML